LYLSILQTVTRTVVPRAGLQLAQRQGARRASGGSATCEGLGPRWVPQRPLRCCSYPSPQQAPHPAHHRRPTQRRRRPVSVPGSPPRFSSSSTTLVRCTFHRRNAGRSSRHSGPPGSDDLPVSAAAVLLAAHSLMPASVSLPRPAASRAQRRRLQQPLCRRQHRRPQDHQPQHR
jgi:hypothetical protein